MKVRPALECDYCEIEAIAIILEVRSEGATYIAPIPVCKTHFTNEHGTYYELVRRLHSSRHIIMG